MPTAFSFRRKQVTGQFSGKILNNAIREILKKEAAPRITATFRRIVANFSQESKVDFECVVRSGDKIIEILVKPIGSEVAVNRYLMLDKYGRKGGVVIKPKADGGMLRYRSTYSTKTDIGRYGGNGKRSGKLVSAKQVIQGEIEARHFGDALEPAIREEIRRQVKISYKRVARKQGAKW